ncbi:3'-5' exonuclease [Actinoplanes sp. NPDC048988]|uniref:3'-5' exonuclease n=1 Tax=Actinoplanes sp. NPDC048988 TaxID=3363901 RepID=UPI00371E42E5
MTSAYQSWHTANLVALDLEGSGAQERDDEQILEIAAIRLVNGKPDMATAYATCLDPGRPIPARPWISPGLSGLALQGEPAFAEIRDTLLARLQGTYLVGHNVSVDWRLLHRHLPELTLAGLIDTYRLAKTADLSGKLSLTDLLARLRLTGAVTTAAPASRPHRALWDTTGAALLLPALIRQHFSSEPTLQQLLDVAGIPTTPASPATPPSPANQGTLFD